MLLGIFRGRLMGGAHVWRDHAVCLLIPIRKQCANCQTNISQQSLHLVNVLEQDWLSCYVMFFLHPLITQHTSVTVLMFSDVFGFVHVLPAWDVTWWGMTAPSWKRQWRRSRRIVAYHRDQPPNKVILCLQLKYSLRARFGCSGIGCPGTSAGTFPRHLLLQKLPTTLQAVSFAGGFWLVFFGCADIRQWGIVLRSFTGKKHQKTWFFRNLISEIHLSRSGVWPAQGRSGGRVFVSQGILQAQGQVLGFPSKAELTAPKLDRLPCFSFQKAAERR